MNEKINIKKVLSTFKRDPSVSINPYDSKDNIIQKFVSGFDLSIYKDERLKIKVFGVGGAGCNIVQKSIDSGLDRNSAYLLNTDIKALNNSTAKNKITLGPNVMQGFGAGKDPENGYRCAVDSKEVIENALEDCNVLFIVAGMGKGTGSGASSYIASLAKQKNILVISVVCTPLSAEGEQAMTISSKYINKLQEESDSIMVFSNEKILSNSISKNQGMSEVYNESDLYVINAIYTFQKLVADSLSSIDFSDFKTTIKNSKRIILHTLKTYSSKESVQKVSSVLNSTIFGINYDNSDKAIVYFYGTTEVSGNLFLEIVQNIKQVSHKDNFDIISCVRNNYNSKKPELQVSLALTGEDNLLNSIDLKETFFNPVSTNQESSIFKSKKIYTSRTEILSKPRSTRSIETNYRQLSLDTTSDIDSTSRINLHTMSSEEKIMKTIKILSKNTQKAEEDNLELFNSFND